MCGVVTSETFAVAYLEFPLSLARRRSNSLSSKTGREFVEKVGKRAKKKKGMKVGKRAKKKKKRNESWEESKKKKKRNDRRGGEKWRKRLPTNLTILKNCVRPRTQRLIGAVLVVLILSTRHINQSRYALFTCVADLVSFDLWSQITNALDWCLFESCLCQGSKYSKYNWRSSSGY